MKKLYIVTERAHLMCPNMNFGICLKLKDKYNKKKFNSTLKSLQKAHPLLRSVVCREKFTDKLYFNVVDLLCIPVVVKDDISSIFEDYKNLTHDGWNVFDESLLKIIVYPHEKDFSVLFVAHHLLCDGRGLLNLGIEFVNSYCNSTAPTFVDEKLIESIDDFPSHSKLPFWANCIVKMVNKMWRKENHTIDYNDYLSFEKKYIQENPVYFDVTTYSGGDFYHIIQTCHENKVSVNDFVVGKMMRDEGCSKVVVAVDIREKLSCYKKGALGNYSTSTTISSRKRTSDVMLKAQYVSSALKRKKKNNHKLMMILSCFLEMNPCLIDAVNISTLGDFPSKAGKFTGNHIFKCKSKNYYNVTNLGKISNKNIADAMFIPPMSPGTKKIWGVVTINDCMKICCAS